MRDVDHQVGRQATERLPGGVVHFNERIPLVAVRLHRRVDCPERLIAAAMERLAAGPDRILPRGGLADAGGNVFMFGNHR